MKNTDWNNTANRFVAFFDIMGFKDMVERNTHVDIVEKLTFLKEVLKNLEHMNRSKKFKKDYNIAETKSITFSDSITMFSKSDTKGDAIKIIMDSYWILKNALEKGIAIKGAISHGNVTVDFENSLFFGRPIIDAFLLHEQLQLYAIVFDHSFEVRLKSMALPSTIENLMTVYKTNLKSGKINHRLIKPESKKTIEEFIKMTEGLYNNVSGGPRIYVDNTIDYFKFLLKKKKI